MPVRPLIQLRSPDDQLTRSRLAGTTKEVTDFGPALQQLVDDLIDTLRAHDIAIGLAAPQIGSDLRVAVIDLKREGEGDLLVLVNPELLSTSGKKDLKRESCMSVPGFRGPVERRHKVTVRYADRHGTSQVLQADGFKARAICHETDHLDGLLYLDRMTDQSQLEPVDFFDSK
jgi:peptide deformylase